MLDVSCAPDDDPIFIDRISTILRGVLVTVRPNQLFTVRVDQWFDHKWLGFSCKVLGALGVHSRRLTLPPFHPHRVTWQRHYTHNPTSGAFDYDGNGIPLAVEQTSASNERRFVSCRPFASSLLVWFSGATQKLGRGSLMVYCNTPSERKGHVRTPHWYVAFRRDPQWKISCMKNVSERELAIFREYSAGA